MKSKDHEEGWPPNIKTYKEINMKRHTDEWDINANTTYKNTHYVVKETQGKKMNQMALRLLFRTWGEGCLQIKPKWIERIKYKQTNHRKTLEKYVISQSYSRNNFIRLEV